jgi:hypothetical protein
LLWRIKSVERKETLRPILFNTEMVKAILDGRKTVTRRLIKLKYGNTHHEMFTNKYGTRLIEIQTEVEGETYGKNPDGSNWHKLRGYIEPQSKYKKGEILYVRETWEEWTGGYVYKVPDPQAAYNYPASFIGKWKPSLHMPKEAARIFLRVISVRCERLNDISEEHAIREGVSKMYDSTPDAEYDEWARRVCQGKKKEEWAYTNYLWHGHFGTCGNGNKISDAWSFQCSGYENAIGSFSSLWNTTVPLKEWEKYGWDSNPWVWVIEFDRISKEDTLQD